jgi:hypothetical protein
VVLIRSRKRMSARVIADRLGTSLPELGRLPKSIDKVEVVGNQRLAKELRAKYKKLELVDIRPASGLVTGVK